MRITLKIRTCLWIVIGLFSTALWASAGLAWLDARQAALSIERMSALSRREIQPLQDASRHLLAASLALNSAYIALQRRDAAESKVYVQKATTAIERASQDFRTFQNNGEQETSMQRPFEQYVKVLQTQQRALTETSSNAYLEAYSLAEKADDEFVNAYRTVLTAKESERDHITAMAELRELLAAKLAAALLILSLAIIVLCLLFIRAGLLTPLAQARLRLARVAAGELEIDQVSARDDEVGALTTTLSRMQRDLSAWCRIFGG